MGRLLAHTKGTAYRGPGLPASAALIDEMTKESVGGLFEVGHGLRGLGQLEERILSGRIGPDTVDEFLQCRTRSHPSTLH